MPLKKLFITITALAVLAPLSVFADIRLGEPDTSALSSGLAGYWSMDGSTLNWSANTIQDISGRGNTGTLVLLATTSSEISGKVGGALKFNGTSSYIGLATAFGQPSTVTISVWFKTKATGGAMFGQSSSAPTASPSSFVPALAINPTGTLRGEFWTGAAGAITSSGTVTDGKWHEAVLVGNGTIQYLYLDGILVGSRSGTLAQSWWSVSQIGTGYDGGAGRGICTGWCYFNGSIDDVRLYTRALSPQEVALMYAMGTFQLGNTPGINSSFSIDKIGTNSGLVAYWPLDGNTTNWATGATNDVSGNAYNGRLTGFSTSTAPVAGKIGGSLSFNGSTTYITTGYTIPAQNSATSFTWSVWAKLNATSHANLVIIGNRGGGGATWIKLTPSAFEYNGAVISYTPPTGQWVLLTIVKNGSSFTYYQNGVVVGSATNSGTSPSYTFYMGEDPGYTSDGVLSGALDDVRIYNRALSMQEVQDLYKAGGVNIDHSNTTAGIGINAGLVGYWTFDGQTINWNAKTITDMSGNGNTLTMSGYNAATTTAPTAGKLGQALKFDDTTQSLSHANIAALNFGTGDFAVSFWMRPVSPWDSGSIGIIGQKTDDSHNGWQIYQDSGHLSQLNIRITQQHNFLTNSTIPTGQWTYATFVRKNGAIFWYLNGKLDNSGTDASSISDTGAFYIGYAPTWTAYYPGALDDVRIYGRALSSQEVQQLYQMGR
ncbi:MAG: LamG domain-containing protein [Candidatus Pacebacteria bacterium]|nr:LamG domain-containing protein [Candidatus Paceibacterota bacterium]